jgi:hypothetical protein
MLYQTSLTILANKSNLFDQQDQEPVSLKGTGSLTPVTLTKVRG